MGTLIGDLPLAHRQVLEHMLAFFKRVNIDGSEFSLSLSLSLSFLQLKPLFLFSDKTRTLANSFGPAWLRAPTGTFNKDNDNANNAVFRIISRQERILEVFDFIRFHIFFSTHMIPFRHRWPRSLLLRLQRELNLPSLLVSIEKLPNNSPATISLVTPFLTLFMFTIHSFYQLHFFCLKSGNIKVPLKSGTRPSR